MKKETKPQHTPTPWETGETMPDEMGIFSTEDYTCVTDSVSDEDAAFIVRAVNSYEKLINTLAVVGAKLGDKIDYTEQQAIRGMIADAIASEGK